MEQTEIGAAPFAYLSELETLEVAAGSRHYSSEDGLLYNEDGTILLACPTGRTGTVQVKEGTEIIGGGAFPSGTKADEIRIPEGVLIMRGGNMASTRSYEEEAFDLYLPDSLTDISRASLDSKPNVVIHCSKGSGAEAFAKEMGLNYVTE